jgi:hypothetical protein
MRATQERLMQVNTGEAHASQQRCGGHIGSQNCVDSCEYEQHCAMLCMHGHTASLRRCLIPSQPRQHCCRKQMLVEHRTLSAFSKVSVWSCCFPAALTRACNCTSNSVNLSSISLTLCSSARAASSCSCAASLSALYHQQKQDSVQKTL